MEFVSHLRRINRLLRKDDRINIDHISLYNSLFGWWYYHRDGENVAICHKKMMRNSAIISKDHYDITLLELDHYGYIMLIPPTEKGQACMVKMIILRPEKSTTDPLPEQEARFHIHNHKRPASENSSKKKPMHEEEDLQAAMKKLVREIIDRVLLLRIHLEKE